MSHLILTRRVGQSIVINVAPGADPEQALHQLLRDDITVEINRVEHGNVRVSIDAPRAIQVSPGSGTRERSHQGFEARAGTFAGNRC